MGGDVSPNTISSIIHFIFTKNETVIVSNQSIFLRLELSITRRAIRQSDATFQFAEMRIEN
jgi:hypothetical protein